MSYQTSVKGQDFIIFYTVIKLILHAFKKLMQLNPDIGFGKMSGVVIFSSDGESNARGVAILTSKV